jgi:hypothetical protein
MNNSTNLTIDDYKQTIPSIFSDKPAPFMSTKYKFANTYELCKEIENNGWRLHSAYQTRLNKRSPDEYKQYCNHIVTFRKSDYDSLKVDDLIPCLYLTNSHNGSSTLKLHSGLHRVVCSNGLVTPMKQLANINISHNSPRIYDVKNFLENYMDTYKDLGNLVRQMMQVDLSETDKEKFAKLSVLVRFQEQEQIPNVEIPKLLQSIRPEDNSNNLWGVFNTLQEKLSKGMFDTIKSNENEKAKIRKGRNIDSQFRYMDFNSKIWSLAKSKLEQGDFQLV